MYRVKFTETGSIHTSTPATLEDARKVAIALFNWHYDVEIIEILYKDIEPVVVEKFKK